MRILHFSDIHLREPGWRVPWRDCSLKRLVGGLNLLAGRSRGFQEARSKVDALARFAQEQAVDLVLFTGDYTAMGTWAEFRLAQQAVAPLRRAPGGYLDVPGNHDLYAWDVIRERRFESVFGDRAPTDLPEYAVGGGGWPFARFVEDHLVVLGVNSARPNPQPWRSSGRIPPDQLAALGSMLQDRRVRDRCVFLLTHYAPCLEEGRPDTWSHGLVNSADFLRVCSGVNRGAILCGHVHRRFLARLQNGRLPVLCAGSATLAGREAFWVYETSGPEVRALPGRWLDGHYDLDRSAAVTLCNL